MIALLPRVYSFPQVKIDLYPARKISCASSESSGKLASAALQEANCSVLQAKRHTKMPMLLVVFAQLCPLHFGELQALLGLRTSNENESKAETEKKHSSLSLAR
jgi:hypothetical protein